MIFAPGKIYPHGTRASYTNCGCRCEACTIANRTYARDYYRTCCIDPEHPGRCVPAEPILAHLLALSESGIGKRRVHELSGVSLSVVDKIRRGERKHVRKRTADAILGISIDQQALGTLTPRTEAEAIVTRLLRHGLPRLPRRQAPD